MSGTTTHSFSNQVTSQAVPEPERMAFVDRLLGLQYVLLFEPTVFQFAEILSSQYNGGYWQFHALSNGGFYMAPKTDTMFAVSCENGFGGELSADALGLTACLYAYSNLSFGEGTFAQACASQYHLLREFMFEHAEAGSISRAID